MPGKRHIDYEVHLKNPQVKAGRERPARGRYIGIPTFLTQPSGAIFALGPRRQAYSFRGVFAPSCRLRIIRPVSSGQIKLLGEGACVILCAEGADVEARTYDTWGVVPSSPASPRASAFHSVVRQRILLLFWPRNIVHGVLVDLRVCCPLQSAAEVLCCVSPCTVSTGCAHGKGIV